VLLKAIQGKMMATEFLLLAIYLKEIKNNKGANGAFFITAV
jgi:hypothetical protein